MSGERTTLMRYGFKLAAAGALTVGTLVVPVAAHAGTSAVPVSWAHRTCWAAQSYIQHPSTVALNTMLTDSTHVGWKYLGEDAVKLYSAVRSGKPAATIGKAEAYFAQDCAKYV